MGLVARVQDPFPHNKRQTSNSPFILQKSFNPEVQKATDLFEKKGKSLPVNRNLDHIIVRVYHHTIFGSTNA